MISRCILKFQAPLFFLLLFIPDGTRADSDAFNSARSIFEVKVKHEIIYYRLMSIFVLPEEEVPISITGEDEAAFHLSCEQGDLTRKGPAGWLWKAPARAGLYKLHIFSTVTTDTMLLNMFVMVPSHLVKNGYLNGYRIGNYPSTPLRQLDIYKKPAGFIEVKEENLDTFISPHFRLKQFLCKQESSFPKYVVIREKLLMKLELILEKVNEAGYRTQTFHIMSGYRTPYYNKAIGNVKYSRHVYGGAVDIFIDQDPMDEMMDDLNRDGKIDFRDAGVLYDIIDKMADHSWYERFLGGLGRYKKTGDHGPFVHVDVRGFRARWGQ